MSDRISAADALTIVSTLHSDTLAIEPGDVSGERAEKIVNRLNMHTTTEMLLILAKFHADLEEDGDTRCSEMLARFAVEFAALESTVV